MGYSLAESYRYCAHLSRTRARNFYYSFLCLPAQKRASMCAVYAFMRYSDDISDDGGGDSRNRLAEWRAALQRAFEGEYGDSPILPAFHDAARRHSIPIRYFQDVIDGAEMDLSPHQYERWADTYDYCYHVASVVGLVCIHVFGFSDPTATEYAEWNGIAFQLTNILRDLQEDARMGRVYLPAEDLRRFGYSEADLRAGVDNEEFRALMKFEVERAAEYYRKSEPLAGLIEPDSRPCLRAMRDIYHGILQRIVAQRYDVFSRRARVPTWRKVLIATGAWYHSRLAQGKRLSRA